MPPSDHEWEFNLEQTLSRDELSTFLQDLAERIVQGSVDFKAIHVDLPPELQTTVRLERHGNRKRFLKIEVQLLSPTQTMPSGTITDVFG